MTRRHQLLLEVVLLVVITQAQPWRWVCAQIAIKASTVICFNVGDSVNDQIKLTTFKKIEESVIEEHGVVIEKKEPIKGNDKEERKSITAEDGAITVAESS